MPGDGADLGAAVGDGLSRRPSPRREPRPPHSAAGAPAPVGSTGVGGDDRGGGGGGGGADRGGRSWRARRPGSGSGGEGASPRARGLNAIFWAASRGLRRRRRRRQGPRNAVSAPRRHRSTTPAPTVPPSESRAGDGGTAAAAAAPLRRRAEYRRRPGGPAWHRGGEVVGFDIPAVPGFVRRAGTAATVAADYCRRRCRDAGRRRGEAGPARRVGGGFFVGLSSITRAGDVLRGRGIATWAVCEGVGRASRGSDRVQREVRAAAPRELATRSSAQCARRRPTVRRERGASRRPKRARTGRSGASDAVRRRSRALSMEGRTRAGVGTRSANVGTLDRADKSSSRPSARSTQLLATKSRVLSRRRERAGRCRAPRPRGSRTRGTRWPRGRARRAHPRDAARLEGAPWPSQWHGASTVRSPGWRRWRGRDNAELGRSLGGLDIRFDRRGAPLQRRPSCPRKAHARPARRVDLLCSRRGGGRRARQAACCRPSSACPARDSSPVVDWRRFDHCIAAQHPIARPACHSRRCPSSSSSRFSSSARRPREHFGASPACLGARANDDVEVTTLRTPRARPASPRPRRRRGARPTSERNR